MLVEIFTLCDSATNNRGKLTITGTFDTIWARQLPATHSQCSIVVRLRFSAIEQGTHHIRLYMTDADGRTLLVFVDGTFSVKINPNQYTTFSNFIVNLQPIKLEKYGAYSIYLAVNRNTLLSLPLFIKPLPSSEESSEG